MLTPTELLQTAFSLHQSGSLADAESLYNQILNQIPNHTDALHMLGILHAQSNRHPSAIALLQKAVALAPQNPQYLADLALALHFANRTPDALAVWQKSLALRPNDFHTLNQFATVLLNANLFQQAEPVFTKLLSLLPPNSPAAADFHNNLAVITLQLDRLPDALSHCQKALIANPKSVSALCNQGYVLRKLRRMNEAVASFRQALALNPNFLDAHSNLSAVLNDLQQFPEAEAEARSALALNPKYPLALYNLANALISQTRLDEAIPLLQQALALNPNLAEAVTALSFCFLLQGKIDDSLQTCNHALALNPNLPDILSHRSSLQNEIGQFDQSLADIRRALQLAPKEPSYHSNLILSMQYHPALSDADILHECKTFSQKFSPPKPTTTRSPSPAHRPLRLAYVSADLRNHVVGRNVLPLFQHHNPSQFQLYVYSNSTAEDAFTPLFQSHTTQWRNVTTLTDPDLASLIASDQIDILVDLSVHSANNRLAALALKPAPIQITFAGYPGGTGLPAFDYRITDPYLDPPENDLTPLYPYIEKPLRLPCFWCYDPASMPPAQDPDPNPLPALSNHFITFSSLTATCKLNPQTLQLWSRVLTALPTSRLHLLVPSPTYQDRLRTHFASLNIHPSRLTFIPRLPRDLYLQQYHLVDIALDTLPYNGHSTTLEALWMGVPTITLLGPRTVSRAGLSILSNLNLQQFITTTPDQFLHTTLSLAQNLPQLQSLRNSLRPQMKSSPLTNPKLFTQNLESLYLQAWQSHPASPPQP